MSCSHLDIGQIRVDKPPQSRYTPAERSNYGGSPMRPAIGLAMILLACLITGNGCARFNLFKRSVPEPAAEVGPVVNTLAPDLTGVDFDGAKFKLSDYRGKVVMVSFWASWCGPCLKLVPHERLIAEKYRGKPFAMIGVNYDDDLDCARKAMARYGIAWRAMQTAGQFEHLRSQWKIRGLPTVAIIDADGVIRSIRVGGVIDEHILGDLVAQAAKR